MIWIYGASWGCKISEQKPSLLVWPKLIRSNLRIPIKNLSREGTCVEWGLLQIQKTRAEWEEGDTLIFCEQILSNKWFFKDKPEITGLGGIKRSVSLSDDEKNYCFKWFDDIYNEELEHFHLQAHYFQLNSWLKEKNMKGHILQGFPRPFIDNLSNLFISKGKTLIEISDAEWLEKPKNYRFYFDKRPGHFSESNHFKIAVQIVKAIKANTSVDFSVKFDTGIITDQKPC